MAQKKSRFLKLFIILALLAICVTVVSPLVIYFNGLNSSQDCDEGFVRDEVTQQCVVESVDETNVDEENQLNDEESCTAAGKTWYAENEVCI